MRQNKPKNTPKIDQTQQNPASQSLQNIIPTFDLNSLSGYRKIFVLVSGGIDSTYLWELIREKYPERTIPVNCVNPMESNTTIHEIAKHPKFIAVAPTNIGNGERTYASVLYDAFQNIPAAMELKKREKYSKKIFQCCKWIKHDAFKSNPMFAEADTCVISGIKAGDGSQRRLFLKSLKDGVERAKGVKILSHPTFTHKHKWGATYVYPFRDYIHNELPHDLVTALRKRYPKLTHSGCKLCPVLVVMAHRTYTDPRFIQSMEYWMKTTFTVEHDGGSEYFAYWLKYYALANLYKTIQNGEPTDISRKIPVRWWKYCTKEEKEQIHKILAERLKPIDEISSSHKAIKELLKKVKKL